MPSRAVPTSSGTIVAVTTELLGDVLAVDAHTGDSTITVDDPNDFDELDAGTLSIGGSQYDYTAVDMDTGVITLAATLGADAFTGDRVNVWDTSLSEQARAVTADVAAAGAEANDDVISAVVAHSLVPLLADGIREPGAGESVTMQLQGLDWVVTDVHGRKPRIQPQSLSATGVTPGSYTNTDLTVGPDGRITAASDGSGGGSAIPSFINMPPTGLVYETVPRQLCASNSGPLTSGKLFLVAIYLPAGTVVSKIAFCTNNTGVTSPTHWWFGLYDQNRVQLAVTADQGSAAWGGNTLKALNVATVASGAASSFTTTYDGLHYLGVMIVASGMPPMACFQMANGVLNSSSVPPILFTDSDTGQTTPPAFPHTAAAGFGGTSVGPWGAVG